MVVGTVDEVRRRGSERAGDQPDVVAERHVEQRLVALRRDVQATSVPPRHGPLLLLHRDPVAHQQVVEERAVLLGKQVTGLLGVDPTRVGADILGGQQQIDPERLATGLLLDPGPLVVQPLRAVRDGAGDSEAARVGHRGHDIAAVTESADREFNAEQFGGSGSHWHDAKSY